MPAAADAAAATEEDGDVLSYLSYDLVSAERMDARRRLSFNSRACSRLPQHHSVKSLTTAAIKKTAQWLIPIIYITEISEHIHDHSFNRWVYKRKTSTRLTASFPGQLG